MTQERHVAVAGGASAVSSMATVPSVSSSAINTSTVDPRSDLSAAKTAEAQHGVTFALHSTFALDRSLLLLLLLLLLLMTQFQKIGIIEFPNGRPTQLSVESKLRVYTLCACLGGGLFICLTSMKHAMSKRREAAAAADDDDLESEADFQAKLRAIDQRAVTAGARTPPPPPLNPFHLAGQPHLPSDVKVTRRAASASDDPCRLCQKDDGSAKLIVSCRCRGVVHTHCLNARRTLSVNKFYMCEVCGWVYDLEKDRASIRASDLVADDNEEEDPEDCPNRTRRNVLYYIRGPTGCLMIVHLMYVMVARVLMWIDSNMVLAEWAHADMQYFTEMEINYSIAVCLVALLILVVATAHHGFSMCIYIWATLPNVLFCLCLGSFVDPFYGFVMFGMWLEQVIWNALVRRELERMVYEWPVCNLRVQ